MTSKYLFNLFQVVIQPVDLFPHTTHYMTLILFMRVSQPDLLYMQPHLSADKEAGLSEEQKFWLEQMINKDSKQGYR